MLETYERRILQGKYLPDNNRNGEEDSKEG